MGKNVALAIIKHEGKVLMVRRKIKEGDLHWQFPGGYIHEGEPVRENPGRRSAKRYLIEPCTIPFMMLF